MVIRRWAATLYLLFVSISRVSIRRILSACVSVFGVAMLPFLSSTLLFDSFCDFFFDLTVIRIKAFVAHVCAIRPLVLFVYLPFGLR